MSDVGAAAPDQDADISGRGQEPEAGSDGAVAHPDNLVRRALQLIPVLVFVGTCLAVVKYALQPITNPDTYFHLRFGSEFLSGWSLRDPGTVTPFATREWLPTQWAPQMVMAWMEDWWGLAGVAWLAGTWYLLFALALYVAARREAPALVAAAITVLALAAAQPALSPRPQVLSYIVRRRLHRRLARLDARRTARAGGSSRSRGCGRSCTACGRWPSSSVSSARPVPWSSGGTR